MLNLSDEWWFLGQAVHWIAWRDDEFGGGGALPENGDGGSIANERLVRLSKKWDAAEVELFKALSDKKLVAYGFDDRGRKIAINHEIWGKAESGNAFAPSIVSYGSEAGGDLGGAVEHGRAAWVDVHLSRREIKKRWPASKIEFEASSPKMTQAELDSWIKKKSDLLGGKRPPRRTWENTPELGAQGVTKGMFERRLGILFPNPKLGRPSKDNGPD